MLECPSLKWTAPEAWPTCGHGSPVTKRAWTGPMSSFPHTDDLCTNWMLPDARRSCGGCRRVGDHDTAGAIFHRTRARCSPFG